MDLGGLNALDEFPPNLAMIDRLKLGFAESHDLAFYEHETIEAGLMRAGLGARDAHLETLSRQGIPYQPGYDSQLYHPSVISRYLDHFNPAAHP